MRIISFVSDNSGPSYHRCIMPLMLMKDVDVFITNEPKEEHFQKGCDIFLFNRVLPDLAIPFIKDLQKKYGFKIIVDIDDYWELDPHHILYDTYQADGYANKQINTLRDADAVFVTQSLLADKVRPYNNNVHVLPNAIPKQGQFLIERTSSPFTRLFWQGSITHQADINLLRRPLQALGPLAGKIKMIMGGYMENEEAWFRMVKDYTADLKHQYKLLPGKHVAEYYQHYSEADVCLVPLVDSPFNRHKSNLKILEAANLGLPVIASKVYPYKDMPVIFANGTAEWMREIKRLVGSKKRQKEAGAELKEYCDTHFNFEKINKERKQIFEHLILTHLKIN